MTPTYIGIDKVIKTIGKLHLGRTDLLIFKTSDDVTFEAVEQSREDIKQKLRWDGFIVVLKNDETLEVMAENKQRELYEKLKAKFGG